MKKHMRYIFTWVKGDLCQREAEHNVNNKLDLAERERYRLNGSLLGVWRALGS
jgi:hypothetical protein